MFPKSPWEELKALWTNNITMAEDAAEEVDEYCHHNPSGSSVTAFD